MASSISTATFFEGVKHRRTVYGVSDKISVSDDRILEIVNETIQTIPSSWNMQSTRIVVTLGKEHQKLWDAISTSAKSFILEHQSEEDWKRNDERFQMFRGAYGTVSL